MDKNTKAIITLTGLLGLIGLVYYFVNKKEEGEGQSENLDNFNQAQERLGIKPTNDVIIVKFNQGNNTAQFYTNNRLIIFDKNLKVIKSGVYQNGGLDITLDDGTEISGSSVYGNLLKTIK
jgi:hypothetical protein